MKKEPVIFVRIYITESSKLLKSILAYLKHDASIQGLTVFRATTGFGETGDHSTALMDLSLDLPLVIEFFDDKKKVMPAIEHLTSMIKPEHIVFWEATTNG